MTGDAAMSMETSLAEGQRCLYCGEAYPLFPPLAEGCPACAGERFRAPLEVTYRYPEVAPAFPERALPGLERFAALLPPLARGLSAQEGGTPLLPLVHGRPEGVLLLIKDESRNPTWSHKDRLNLVVVSAARLSEAAGVVAASSGNHGASAAAYAARAGLPAVVLTTPRPPALASFLQAYGALVVAVPDVETRWRLMRRLVEEAGFHPASNQTLPPTNHPFGSEGYKTIAYELYLQLGGEAPEAVFVPVGFAELIFGIYKGFAELRRFGLIGRLPRLFACEPAAGAPLAEALRRRVPVAWVETGPTDAYAIAVPVNSYRGVVAVRESGGAALPVTDAEMRRAQQLLAGNGLWVELSAAASLAGAFRALAQGMVGRGPLVCISTSSGFKDVDVGANPVPEIDGTWEALKALLVERGWL